MKVSAAIEALKALPQDRELMCQVVAQDGTVWNCFYEFHNVPHSDWLCQLRVSHTELKTLNGVGASRDSIIEECAKAAENTPTALLQNGQFFSERVAMAIRALLVGACPCTPADRAECASTPDVDKPTNCVRRRTGCPHEWVSAVNNVVRSGEVCLKCHAVRSR